MKGCHRKLTIIFELFVFFHSLVWGETDPSDAAVLDSFRKGLENPELLRWGNDDNPCGPPAWPRLVCSGDRVTHIQVKNLGLIGPLPQNFNKLSKLKNLGLQRNNFTGKLPSFSGLAELQFAYLGNNQFDTIPYDFFTGLDNLQVLSLDYNPLNKTGWSVPLELRNSAQLMNLSMMSTNIIGPLPEFLSELSSLTALKLSFNRFTGEIPRSYQGSQFQILWLNGNELTGPIDVVASMLSLKLLWLNFNQFTGKIPAGLANCTSLTDLWLDHNHLVGPIPEKLTSLPLNSLRLDANKLMGPIPKFSKGVASYADNSFCQSRPGVPCSPEVSTLLDFLSDVNYPLNLASSWLGNDPCTSSWLGITCSNQRVSVINLPNLKLNGTLSPALGQLDSLARIMLEGNNLTGVIPENYTKLNSLRLLDLTDNNLEPPIPAFSNTVKLVIAGNQFLTGREPEAAPFPSTPRPPPPSSPYSTLVPNINPNTSNSSIQYSLKAKNSKLQKLWVIIIPSVVLLCLSLLIFVWCKKKRRGSWAPPFVVHPRDPSGSEVKIVIANEANGNSSTNESTSQSKECRGGVDTHVFESGNLVISVQVLRSVTKNFASHNELGRGGFGTVYKGKFQDGSVIAVKRMESCVISNKAIDEFQSEIAVLSKVRHRHLVSLLGYSIEGNERLLVYEYMPLGALSTHLFQWKLLNLEPLSWKRRLNIALDVARGMEYLHNLAQQSFIHRDLKSSNILLGDDFRAKVSDFGLVKLAPDGKHSVATRLAGTFGYLAPEYAVTGKITTKADVFSYGVVLMELVTGLTALDEERPEESRYLAEWFWCIKSNKERLRAAIDPSLDVNEETIESIFIVAEMAGHCTARDPNQRPDMSHAVTVLAPLVEKWRPVYDDQEEYMGIDCSQPLGQMVKLWQATDISGYFSNDDSRGSIPPVPSGFGDSFAPIDAR